MHALWKKLCDKALLQNHINKLKAKLSAQNRLYDSEQNHVSFAQFCMHEKKLAKALSLDIAKAQYHLNPAQQRQIIKNEKTRIIYEFCLTDRIILAAMLSILNQTLLQTLSKKVYSYIPKRSSYMAVRSLAKYVKHQPAIFVIHCDIASYTDTIPTGKNAPIWRKLRALLQQIDNINPIDEYLWQLLQSSIMPQYYDEAGNLRQLTHGLPQGSAITTLIANLYLSDVDHLFDQDDQLFYARYGDDWILAHNSSDKVKQHQAQFIDALASLHLESHSDKTQAIYVTAGAKAYNDPFFTGENHIGFLGFDVFHDGSIGLGKIAFRKLLLSLKRRIRYTLNQYKSNTQQKQGLALCRTINHAFNKEHPYFEKRLYMLLSQVTSRSQLKHLDYLLALYIAQSMSGIKSVKAFRHISYNTIRHHWKLKSLCQLRNQK